MGVGGTLGSIAAILLRRRALIGSACGAASLVSLLIYWARLTVAMTGLVLLAAPAQPQQAPSVPTPDAEVSADVKALCNAWRLTELAIKLAGELKSVSEARVDQTGKLADACKAKPQCAQSRDREKLDKDLRDAGNQQAKAIELAATMEERKRGIRERLERIYGKDAVEKCGET